jgi:hypothetical protein
MKIIIHGGRVWSAVPDEAVREAAFSTELKAKEQH